MKLRIILYILLLSLFLVSCNLIGSKNDSSLINDADNPEESFPDENLGAEVNLSAEVEVPECNYLDPKNNYDELTAPEQEFVQKFLSYWAIDNKPGSDCIGFHENYFTDGILEGGRFGQYNFNFKEVNIDEYYIIIEIYERVIIGYGAPDTITNINQLDKFELAEDENITWTKNYTNNPNGEEKR